MEIIIVNPDSVPELYNALLDLVKQIEVQEEQFSNQTIDLDITTGRALKALEWARERKK